MDDVVAFMRGGAVGRSVGVDPVPLFETVTRESVRESLLPVTGEGARDLLTFLAVGSFYDGPDPSLREPDEVRDGCVREVLASVGDRAVFFTNHGHAGDVQDSDGDPGPGFMASGFHWNSLAVTLYDVCLIGSPAITCSWPGGSRTPDGRAQDAQETTAQGGIPLRRRR
ncbi:hypothetical protein [Streptomyces sp. YIM S03343]